MRSDALVARHETLRLPRGRSVAYRDCQGPPGATTVLLLHGIGMTATSTGRLVRYAASTIPGSRTRPARARPQRRCQSPDFRLEDCADDVGALANALGIERFNATGYSMGGLIAQLLWRRHPERTSRLVLGASSRNFLGTLAERMASLFAPAFTVAVRMNPLCTALGAGCWVQAWSTTSAARCDSSRLRR